MASSMSRIDMWQPEHPSNHNVATRAFFMLKLPVGSTGTLACVASKHFPVSRHTAQAGVPVPPHACTPRLTASHLMLSWLLVISSTPRPFSASAPVGHTCTHLPHLVHDFDSPQGPLSSATKRELMPRPLISHTFAPSTSAHTRTQRVQRMHRL